MSSSNSSTENDFKYYHYNPSLAAAAIFTTFFFLLTFLHLYQLIRTRTWVFIPFIIGGLFETAGYLGRIISATETPNWSLGVYIMQFLLLLVAPALFAASIYMVLGRIVRLTGGERHSLIPQKWLTKVFVTGDIVSFITQGAGGGIMGSGNSQQSNDIGKAVIVTGLGIQVLVFDLFVVVAGIFHHRLVRQPTDRVQNDPTLPCKKHLYVLYGTSMIIWVRSVFRLIEFAQGQDGYLLSLEVWLYVFDAVLMFSVMAWLAVVHTSEVYALLKGGKCKAVRKGILIYEMKGVGYDKMHGTQQGDSTTGVHGVEGLAGRHSH